MTVAACKKSKLKKVSDRAVSQVQECGMSEEGGDPGRIGLKTRWLESLQTIGGDP